MNTAERHSYLDAPYGIKSWLLTKDHKRIAMLYLMSITVFFAVGGLFALLVRLELLTPQGALHARSPLDPARRQLPRADPPDARAGPDVVPAAAVRVGALRDESRHDPRHAGGRDHAGARDG